MSHFGGLGGIIHSVTFGTESYEAVASLIQQCKSKDVFSPVTVIVPSQYCGVHIRRELSREHGLLNVGFMTLSRLAEYLGASKLVQRGKSPLASSVELAVIRSIVSDKTETGPFSAIADHEGLPKLLINTFSSLSKLVPSELDNLKDSDPFRSQLVDWYSKYKELTAGYYSSEEALVAALENIRDKIVSDVMRDLGKIIVYLPRELTRTQINLIAELTDSYDTEVVVGFVGERDADAYSNKSINLLSNPSQDTVISVDKADLRANHLVSASDLREEVRWVVRDICSRAESGMPFYRMAVAYQDNDYASLVQRQLAFAGIPIAGPNPSPYSATAVGRSLAGILAAIESDLSRREVMKWLSESPVRIASNIGDAVGMVTAWDFLSKSAGIVHGVDQWKDRLSILQSKLKAQISNITTQDELTHAKFKNLTMMASATEALFEFIVKFSDLSAHEPFNTWAEAVDWIINLLDNYSISESELPEHEMKVLENLLRSIEEISVLDETDIPVSTTEFIRLINNLLKDNHGSRYGDTGSGVFLSSIETLYGMDFDIVYFLGMCEGVVPRPLPADPLLPAELRSEIGDSTISLSLKDFADQQRRYFLSAVLSAKEHVLLYPRSNNISQSPAFPSHWFMDEMHQFSGERILSDGIISLEGNSWITVISSPVHFLNMRENLVPTDIHERDVASLYRWSLSNHKVASHYLFDNEDHLRKVISLANASVNPDMTEWDGDLSAITGVGSGISRGILSATGLESWSKCPFSYFLGHMLGVELLKDPEEVMNLSALDKGTLVHAILERIVDDGVNLLPASDVDYHITRICEEEFKTAEDNGLTGRHLFWQKAKSEILRDIRLFVANDGELIDAHNMNTMWTEKPFGFDRKDSLPPLVIELNDGTNIRFRGIIDRVDLSQNRDSLSVIDYKTGSSNPYKVMDVDPLDSGRKLQLPIYGLVAREAFSDISDVQSAYWFVSSASNFERKSIDLVLIEDQFREVINGIAKGIKEGLFPMNPGKSGRYGPENCAYCDFDRICPKNRSSVWATKQNDTRLKSYINVINAGNLERDLDDD